MRITFYVSTCFLCSSTTMMSHSFPVFQVALHEIGHVLQLGHNANNNSIMYPLLVTLHQKLSDLDKKMAQTIWGSRKSSIINDSVTTKTPQTTSSSDQFNPFMLLKVVIFLISIIFFIIVLAACLDHHLCKRMNDI